MDTRRQNTSVQLRSLRIFCDVVRRRSFSQAAQDHGLTQGAASQAVQHLEDYLAVQLIDRSKRPLVLTAEGEKFYDGVANLLRQFDTLVEETQGGDGEVAGEVAVGAIYSIGLSYLPSIQERFRNKFPGAVCQTKMAHPHEVYRMVEQGAVDFGVISYPTTSRYISSIDWRDERMILVGSPRHRLAMAGPISVADLNAVGLVAFAPNLPIRIAIDKKLRSMGVSMRVVVELDNIDSVKHAAIVNSGVAFLPEPTVQNEMMSGSLKAIQCDDLMMTRPLAIIQRRDLPLSRAARGMLELMLQDASTDSSSNHSVLASQLPEEDRSNLSLSAAFKKLKAARPPR